MNRPRGACPSILAPMETGDGLLARLSPPDGSFTAAAFAALCDAARRHGNGLIEVTARGSLQVRGLSAESAPLFAAEVGEGGGLPLLVNPLAGLDGGIDLRPLGQAIKAAADARFPPGALAPKVSLLLDGGGALHLDDLAADVRLLAADARRIPDGPQDRSGISGDVGAQVRRDPGSARDLVALVRDTEFLLFCSNLCLGLVTEAQAVDAVLSLLAALRDRRARDLDEGEARAAVAGLVRPATAPARRSAAEPLGRHRLADGTWALGVGLAFGQAEAADLAALTEGVRSLHPAPGRALLLAGLSESGLEAAARRAESLGFVTRPDDPRRALAACPGAPACGSGEIAARALTPALLASGLLDGSVTAHLSGCAKGCAQPGPASLTLVGRDGACDLVVGGSARGAAVARLASSALPAALARLARQRRSGESMAAALERLGGGGVAAVISGQDGNG